MFEAMRDRERAELALSLSVSSGALERLGVGAGHDRNGTPFSSWPERNPSGRTVGIIRRYADGTKKHAAGGKAALYLPARWWDATGPVLLPEGGSDCAALVTMGLCAVGRPSNVGGIDMLVSLLGNYPDRVVVVLGENDRKPDRVGTVAQCDLHCPGCSWCWPGLYGATATAQRLTKALGRLVHHRQVVGAKDARAWLQSHGVDRGQFLESLRSDQARVEVGV